MVKVVPLPKWDSASITPAVSVNERFNNRQAQTRFPALFCPRLIGPIEAVEHEREVGAAHPDAVVGDAQHCSTGAVLGDLDFDLHHVLRVLDGVVEQVQERRLEARGIASERQLFRPVEADVLGLELMPGAGQRDRPAHQLGEIQGLRVEPGPVEVLPAV